MFCFWSFTCTELNLTLLPMSVNFVLICIGHLYEVQICEVEVQDLILAMWSFEASAQEGLFWSISPVELYTFC